MSSSVLAALSLQNIITQDTFPLFVTTHEMAIGTSLHIFPDFCFMLILVSDRKSSTLDVDSSMDTQITLRSLLQLLLLTLRMVAVPSPALLNQYQMTIYASLI